MATIYQRGDYYYLNYTDANGRQREPLGKISKKRAENLLRIKEYELAYPPKSREKPQINFREYVNVYLEVFELKFPSSYETSRHTLIDDFEPLLKDLMLHEITIKDINGFIGLKKNIIKTATINRKLSILRALLNQAKNDGFDVTDTKIVELPDDESRPPKYFTVDELEDINNDSMYIVSTSGNRTKSRKWRYVRITDNAKASLDKFDMSGEYLLPRVHNDMPKTRFRRVCKKAGIKQGKWGVHCLRHTFASHLVMGGVPIRTVQVLLGHASIKTTERYAHLSPDYLRDSMGNLNL